jgi:hypothetical protein
VVPVVLEGASLIAETFTLYKISLIRLTEVKVQGVAFWDLTVFQSNFSHIFEACDSRCMPVVWLVPVL